MTGEHEQSWHDAIAFSGLIPAWVAGSLVLATGLALGARIESSALHRISLLAVAGTLVVYNVDRLRDLERDRASAPARTRFVSARRRSLTASIAVAALLCLPMAARLRPEVWLLCGAVLALGLLHRRLKTRPLFKLIYLGGAWTAIVVGLPVLALPETRALPGRILVCGAMLGAAISANLVASQLREGRPKEAAPIGLGTARALALAGALAPLPFAPACWPLAAVPAAQLVSLLAFRGDERFASVAVDGALAVGAAIATGLLLMVR